MQARLYALRTARNPISNYLLQTWGIFCVKELFSHRIQWKIKTTLGKWETYLLKVCDTEV